jgi:RNA polymerase sigma factor (sigma-70 family)
VVAWRFASWRATRLTLRSTQELAEHFFRHQSGQLNATLTRVLGTSHWELVEDVVQSAFLQALRTWPARGVPNDPAAWLFRVARNLALDQLRRDKLAEEKQLEYSRAESNLDPVLHSIQNVESLEDDQLQLLTLCCHPELPAESQVALALKLVAGFSSAEMARALLTNEENINKRLTRAKQRLREEAWPELSLQEVQQRLPLVLNVIYLLFNEGYHTSYSDLVLRSDLCEEALRLGSLVATHESCSTPGSQALLALMLFHVSRFAARVNEQGQAVLLEDQDRQKWDQELIGEGLRWLWASGHGEVVSSYHLEAGIAAEHCLAPSFAETNWPRILLFYDQLVTVQPTTVNRLNRAIAVAYTHGPLAGLKALAQINPEELPKDYTYWDVAHARLYRQLGEHETAQRHFRQAFERNVTPHEKAWIANQLCSSGDNSVSSTDGIEADGQQPNRVESPGDPRSQANPT